MSEELIDYNFRRNVETGAYEFDILVSSTKTTTEHTLKEDVAYYSQPLHGRYGFCFMIKGESLKVFRFNRDADVVYEFQASVYSNQKSVAGALRKMLDRTTDLRENQRLWKELNDSFDSFGKIGAKIVE